MDSSLSHVLNALYHEHSIYRTIVICRTQDLDTIQKELNHLQMSYAVFYSMNSLDHFHRSNDRIFIVPFKSLYFYRSVISEWMVREHYLFYLYELLSLQEQCCLEILYRSPIQNYYVYMD